MAIIEEIERISRNFLWGSTLENHKYHLLSWEKLCIPMKQGGLGIKRLREVNRALLSKWLWNFGKGERSLWKRLVADKYGVENGKWFTKKCNKAHGCGLWKGIMGLKDLFECQVSYVVGRGDRIRFWEDKWISRESLRIKFPNLYAVSRKQEEMIGNVLQTGESGVSLNLDCRRRLTETEIKEAVSLNEVLKNFEFTGEEDSRFWGDKVEDFTVKTMTKWMEERSYVSKQLAILAFPKSKVWNSLLIPPKVAFFLWTVVRGRVLTVDKIQKRGMNMVNRCVMCKLEEETCDHLFLECSVARKIWDSLEMGCDGNLNFSLDLKRFILHNGSPALTDIGKLYWEFVFHATIWGIWLERNRRVFEGLVKPIDKIIGSIKKLMWSWGLGDSLGRTIKEEQIKGNWKSVILM
ncbi:hypothetical protein ACHQM5_021892 [Ranunculus cassubicifolius]